jgi:hypothetical protein
MIKYPKYRVSQWLDTSEESMSKPEADIVFGVQTQRFKGGAWMHVSQNGKALFFKTDEDATKACESLLANDRSSATPEKMP